MFTSEIVQVDRNLVIIGYTYRQRSLNGTGLAALIAQSASYHTAAVLDALSAATFGDIQIRFGRGAGSYPVKPGDAAAQKTALDAILGAAANVA